MEEVTIPNEIYTVGHSNHTTETFLNLLRSNGITAIADVRSAPHTRVNPDFCRPALDEVMNLAGIVYVFMGSELGARSAERYCYVNGRVSYDRLSMQAEFRDGLKRIERGSTKFRMALLCAEKEPLQCHRCILVARHLVSRGLSVSHILADGSIERHHDTIARLKQSLGLTINGDMFNSDEDLTNLAYTRQEEEIAYIAPGE